MKRILKTVVLMMLMVSMLSLAGCGTNKVTSNAMTGEEFTLKMAEMGFMVTQLEPERDVNSYVAVKKHLSTEAAEALMETGQETFTGEELQEYEWIESTVMFMVLDEPETFADKYKASVQTYKELAAQSDAEVIEEENKAYFYADGWYKRCLLQAVAKRRNF